jgi:hypothetical protein
VTKFSSHQREVLISISKPGALLYKPVYKVNVGCLHPVARVRSDDVVLIRLRNVTIVG